MDRGWFVEPTDFADLDNRDRIAREEIFGPVLVVIPCDSEDDAVAIANDPNYAFDAACRVRTGSIGINYFNIDVNAPNGVIKDSGIGRERGPAGVEEYFELKSMFASAAQLK